MLCVALLLLGITVAHAYVASSSNYRIQEDSINSGGLLSTSTNYRIEDTLGESGVGTSSSATYQIKAGYQQMQEVYLAISVPGNITLLPNVPSTGGGTADGSLAWTVTTDNAAGFTMNLAASGTPILKSGANSFADYVPAGANPDFTFATPAASSNFGFTPEGADITQRYKDNGAACNIGALDTGSACWSSPTTSPTTIVARTNGNHPLGSPTTLRFRAASDIGNTQPAGSYTATATLTVLAL